MPSMKVLFILANLKFVLCAILIYSSPVMHILIFTHLIKSHKCSLYYDTKSIQIDLVVAEIFHYGYATYWTGRQSMQHSLTQSDLRAT